MNFLDWMNMNMAIDIACIVFVGAFIWKFRKVSKTLELHKKIMLEMNDNIKIIDENCKELREDLTLTMKNPQAARRKLNQNK